MGQGKLFAFEGLDCSFKETNSKAYLDYLRSKGRKAELFSFPRYDKESSYFVREYLGGKYGNQDTIPYAAISLCYMMDMFDCAKKHIIPLMEQGVDIVLDRYWYSNIYYRIGLLYKNGKTDRNIFEELKIEKTIMTLADNLGLPKADYIIKLQANIDVMLEFVRKKNLPNDQHESDEKFLIAVSKAFENCGFSTMAKNPSITVMTTDDMNIRSREDILKDIIEGIGI